MWRCAGDKLETPLVIACAANAQFAMKAVVKSFKEEYGIICQITTASSGKLTAQIIQGAPYDVFVSADMKYPATLHAQNKTLIQPQIYAHGKLVLWSLIDSLTPNMDKLVSAEINHIGLANPLTAPYGLAAKQLLDALNLDIEDRLVFGESISQVNQFVVSQAVELGFTAKSVVVSDEMQGRGRWIEVDSDLYDPILQGVVAIKNRRGHHEEAQKFISYLLSDVGQKILDRHGYETIKNQ